MGVIIQLSKQVCVEGEGVGSRKRDREMCVF